MNQAFFMGLQQKCLFVKDVQHLWGENRNQQTNKLQSARVSSHIGTVCIVARLKLVFPYTNNSFALF